MPVYNFSGNQPKDASSSSQFPAQSVRLRILRQLVSHRAVPVVCLIVVLAAPTATPAAAQVLPARAPIGVRGTQIASSAMLPAHAPSRSSNALAPPLMRVRDTVVLTQTASLTPTGTVALTQTTSLTATNILPGTPLTSLAGDPTHATPPTVPPGTTSPNSAYPGGPASASPLSSTASTAFRNGGSVSIVIGATTPVDTTLVQPTVANSAVGPPAVTPLALGAYVSVNGQFVNDNPSLLDWYANLVGRMPAIVNFGGDLVHSTRFDQVTMDAIRARGAIPMYTMDPANDFNRSFQPMYTDAQIAAGRYDQYFRLWAQSAAAWGHPLLLRFAPEFDGWWFSWGTAQDDENHNTPAQFVAMWRHVHDIFTAAGATNVQWVWCANTDDPGTTPYALDYPGDAYVDWVAMDGYNWGAYPYHVWRSFPQVFGSSYNEITALTNKPVMIGETGSVDLGGDKAAWITDAFLNVIPQDFPRIRAVVVFEGIDEHDWRMDSTPGALAAFRTVVASPLYQGAAP